MPRYIDADKIPFRFYAGDELMARKDVIDAMPTVSPDEVRGVGKWERVETEFGLRCPKCGKLLDDYVNGGEWVDLVEIPNYCPNCGAKMEME